MPVTVQAQQVVTASRTAADAAAYERYPDGNAGRFRRLLVKGGRRRVISYVRFRIDPPAGEVERAVLRLYAKSGTRAGPAVYETSPDWSERRLTWNSRPSARGPALDIQGRIRPGRWVRFDVTAAIDGASEFSFMLQSNSPDGVTFKSGETRKKPRLAITTSEEEPSSSPSPSRSPSRSPSPSPSPSRTSSPTPGPVTGDVVIAAAGDIACDPDDKGFDGNDPDRCQMEATSDLLLDGNYDAVLTLGDNQYNSGTLSEFEASYDPTWGRLYDITYPSPGNHEYGGQEGRGYYDYFGSRAGNRDEGYYSFDLGDWHFVALNTNLDCTKVACDGGSEQFEWLEDDLAASDAECTLAFLHHPRFSSGHGGNSVFVSDIYEELYDAGTEILLAGHSHNYERFAPLDPDGNVDPDGIREFVVGTGGAFFTGFSEIKPHSEARNNRTFGILELELDDDAYEWRFVPVPGGAFTDSGTGTCH